MPAMPKDPLSPYREKRDFGATPEPRGSRAKRGALAPPRFVIQEHHASHLHWDLRLERNGVLVSWAVPRGLPLEPKRNNLAVHTEDHPLVYFDFHGTIPEGNYGAGEMYIWDQGTYDCEKFEDKKVVVTLHGKRARGKYALFQTGGKNWMIHRMDPPEDPTLEPMPQNIAPMLAKLGVLPRDDARYGFEIKWDGIRAISYIDAGHLKVESRNRLDITSQYPELRRLGESLGIKRVVLDGEIVALDEHNRPNFGRLQGRMHLASAGMVRRRMESIPITYMIFDLLYEDGHSLFDQPFTERRRRLEKLALAGPAWQTPAYHAGAGRALLEASREQGLEGIIAKRLDGKYEPGKRTGCWIKLKNQQRQELLIAGWVPGAGGREGQIGSLLLGYYDKTQEEAERLGKPQRLHYAGNVGTGFSDAFLNTLWDMLQPLKRATNPFAVGRGIRKDAVFVEPQLVGEIEYTEITAAGILRHPSFKGLRPDKEPRDVILETISSSQF